MSLNYTASKNIIIEAKESCRVPVPVEKCPLERLLAAEQMQASSDNNHSKSIFPYNCHIAITMITFFCSFR